jgi:hypothetical protein
MLQKMVWNESLEFHPEWGTVEEMLIS